MISINKVAGLACLLLNVGISAWQFNMPELNAKITRFIQRQHIRPASAVLLTWNHA
jgi:hypothetical protein